MSDTREILGTVWKSQGMNTIGIVAVKTAVGWRSYMAVVSGFDEEHDRQSVAKIGAKLHKSEAMGFFPNLDPETFEE